MNKQNNQTPLYFTFLTAVSVGVGLGVTFLFKGSPLGFILAPMASVFTAIVLICMPGANLDE